MFRYNSKHQYRPDLNDSDGDYVGQEKDSGSPPRGSSPPPPSSSGMDSAPGSSEMDRGGPKERGTFGESDSNGGVKADGGGGSPQSEPASDCSGAPVAEGTGNLNDKVDEHFSCHRFLRRGYYRLSWVGFSLSSVVWQINVHASYGCLSVEEIESYSRQYNKHLEEEGSMEEIPNDLALEICLK